LRKYRETQVLLSSCKRCYKLLEKRSILERQRMLCLICEAEAVDVLDRLEAAKALLNLSLDIEVRPPQPLTPDTDEPYLNLQVPNLPGIHAHKKEKDPSSFGLANSTTSATTTTTTLTHTATTTLPYRAKP
jgi:hypothetical protein